MTKNGENVDTKDPRLCYFIDTDKKIMRYKRNLAAVSYKYDA